MTAERLDTFSAMGRISSLIFDSGTSLPPATTNGNQSHTSGNQTKDIISPGTDITEEKGKHHMLYLVTGT